MTKLADYIKCNYYKSNNRVNRYKSINIYKNKKLELLIRKKKIKAKNEEAQNIFELINFQEILLNHYKNFKFYYNKSKENTDIGENTKYIKYDNILLGKGAFGECYQFRAIDKEDMNFYAGKIIKKENVGNNRKTLLDEIQIQRQFKDNPKVVKVKDYFEDDENVYIILELCKNKSLADYLKEKKNKRLKEIEVKCFIFQLLQGLKCLHKKKVIHRDLKPNNLLLGDNNELKIGDFGIIAHLSRENERRYTICGTYNYMAPEIFENNKKGYSFEVDIWSVGIIMYQLLTGNLIFNGNKEEIPSKILRFQPEDLDVSEISEVAANLIKQILVKNPKKRPGINQILYHYFFHDIVFPKYITPEILKKYEDEKEEIKEEENVKKQNLKMELNTLIVDDIPEIEYESIKNYVIKEYSHVYDHYITYYHQSSHYNLCYYEFNNEIIGIIDKNIQKNKGKRKNDINMIYNTETKFFYFIKVDEDNIEDDILERYTEEEIPEDLKKVSELFLSYYKSNLKRKKNIEVKDENLSFKVKENSLPSTQKSEENSIISQNRIQDKSNLVYVRSIIVYKQVSLLYLSDKTLEAIFTDKVKILLSDINQKIEIMDQYNNINVISTMNAFQNSNVNFTDRLKLIKKVMYNNIWEKSSEKNKENNQNPINDVKEAS